jgi:hypothetical protein
MDIVGQNKSTSLLLSRVVSYLEHDRKRRAFLSKYPFMDVQLEGPSSTLRIGVPLLKSDSHRSSVYASLREREIHWLNLSWGWSWTKGKESLGVVQPHPGTEAVPAGIEQLVELTGSCENAILFILNLPAANETAATVQHDTQGPVGEYESEDGEKEAADHSGLSEYELLRLKRIKRNEQRLKELGLDGAGLVGSVSSTRKRRRR